MLLREKLVQTELAAAKLGIHEADLQKLLAGEKAQPS